jgi:hypothetical protein
LVGDGRRVCHVEDGSRLSPSVAAALRNLPSTKLFESPAIKAAAASLSYPPIVAPQIAEALGAIEPLVSPSLAEALKMNSAIAPAAFDVSKTLLATGMAANQSGIFEAIKTLELSSFVGSFSALPSALPDDFGADLEQRAEEVITLAEVQEVAAVVDSELRPLAGLSATQQRAPALDVVLLIAALLVLYATAKADDVKLAAAALTTAAALVRVYWRLTGKLE